MNFRINHLLPAALVLVLGCAQPRRAPVAAADTAANPIATISVHVGGVVNKPGQIELGPPLTIAHAIELAGGIRASESEYVSMVKVVRQNGREFIIHRRDRMTLNAENGDWIWIAEEIRKRPTVAPADASNLPAK